MDPTINSKFSNLILTEVIVTWQSIVGKAPLITFMMMTIFIVLLFRAAKYLPNMASF